MVMTTNLPMRRYLLVTGAVLVLCSLPHAKVVQARAWTPCAAHLGQALGPNAGTSSAINTTGCDLLIVGATWFTGIGVTTLTPSDSRKNTWNALTKYSDHGEAVQMWYAVNPKVGNGHTFSLSGNNGSYASILVSGFDGTDRAPFDVQSGSSIASTGTSMQPGSVTPSENNELLVTVLITGDNGGSVKIDSGFTIRDTVAYVINNNMSASLAYKIQKTASAEHPTWSWASAANRAAALAAFKTEPR